MILVNPKDIVIPENRFRREFDERKLLELEESILRNGLMHPPSVERNQASDNWTLRGGERRYRVLSRLVERGAAFRVGGTLVAANLVPAIEWGELNALQRLEIEVEENVVRLDFTWQERTDAIAALHNLRKTQNPAQSIQATATEILGRPSTGGDQQPVADALVIAKYMHLPEVAKAKDAKSALKVIRKIADAGHRATLAKNHLAVSTPHTLIKGECLHVLSQLPAASFDVILTDPPYGVDADGFGDMASTVHDYKDSLKNWEEIMQVFPSEAYRVAKERAHAYVFCDRRQFDRLEVLMVLANWTVFPHPLIWYKGNGMLPFPDHGPRRTYECILYAWKGDRKVLSTRADVIDISGVKRILRGAQKPVALYADLLSRSANPGDTVLDCFGGTGPILVAANRMQLVATYVEREDDAFNIAQMRKDQKEIDDGAEENDGLGDIPIA